MSTKVFNKKNNVSNSLDDTVEVKIFQNKNNKQYTLPVLKKNTSPKIIQDILNNKDIVGLKFRITDVILKNNKKVSSKPIYISPMKGGKKQ